MSDCKHPNYSGSSSYSAGCRCDGCRQAWAKYMKPRQRAKTDIRMPIIRHFKTQEGCIDCGYNENPHALTFDHVRGEKKFGVTSSMGNRSWESILNEIDKCEVRCFNCHMIKTQENKEGNSCRKD